MLLGVAAVEPIQQGQISQAGKAAHTELFAAGNGARDHSGLPVLQRDRAVVLTTVNDGHSVYRLGAERSRSEERRVGKECRSRWSADHEKRNGKRARRATM